MRDYPSVPNVFRVASLQSVNTDVSFGSVECADNKIVKSKNANLHLGAGGGGGVGFRPPAQQEKQQTNSHISGQQQQLKTNTNSDSNQQQQQQQQQSCKVAATTFHGELNCAKKSEANANNNNIQLHANRQQQQLLRLQRLTAHDSIERPIHNLHASQLYLLHSPYATLPRNNSASLSTCSLHNLANKQQQQPNSIDHSKVTAGLTRESAAPAAEASAANEVNSSNTMANVINTISGSIPSTGFSTDFLTTSTAATTNARQHQHTNGDLNRMQEVVAATMTEQSNGHMNNSFTNVGKLNGGVHKQQQQQQHQQLSLQRDAKTIMPTPTAAKHDGFTAPYRRSQPYPCSTLERNANGYLWIVTPVAAR